MITVFGGDSPNVIKVLITLEELGAAYCREPVDVTKGEQFAPTFLAMSPNNRIPAMRDDAPADGEGPLTMFESGAMLIYLAEKYGRLLPTAPRPRSAVIAWVMWQMAGQGPMLGQANHFCNYAPEKIPYAINRYRDEAARLYRVLDTRLADRSQVADDYSIADIACWPWLLFRGHHAIELTDYPNLNRWFLEMEQRPAVQRAMASVVVGEPQNFDDKTKAILFNANR